MSDTSQDNETSSKRHNKPLCKREGCILPRGTSQRDSQNYHCSGLCRTVDVELRRTERVCNALGSNGELWAAAVAVNDALTEYRRLHAEVREAARSVGITNEQWKAICFGAG